MRLEDALLRRALEEALAALAGAGVSPVALKGPVLADRIYPDPPLRPAGDLDLLVAEPELEAAAAALLRMGSPGVRHWWRPTSAATTTTSSSSARPGRRSSCASAPRAASARPFRRASCWRGPAHRTGGAAVRVLAPEDELLVLAVHAAAHMLARGTWLLDLLLFLERHPALDWAEVRRRALAWRCARPLAWALSRLVALGAPVPAELLAPLGSLAGPAATGWPSPRCAAGGGAPAPCSSPSTSRCAIGPGPRPGWRFGRRAGSSAGGSSSRPWAACARGRPPATGRR